MPFDKFPNADRQLGTQMKATGEVMAIGRTFEESFLKAVRSLEMKVDHLEKAELKEMDKEELLKMIKNAYKNKWRSSAIAMLFFFYENCDNILWSSLIHSLGTLRTNAIFFSNFLRRFHL